jgi:hypothetical protein
MTEPAQTTASEDDHRDLPQHLRQIANEIDEGAENPPCSEAELVRLAADEIERLRSHIASLDYIPLRYRDRPPGFVEARRKICDTPHVCFEFGDQAPVCGPCDTAAIKSIYQERQP